MGKKGKKVELLRHLERDETLFFFSNKNLGKRKKGKEREREREKESVGN